MNALFSKLGHGIAAYLSKPIRQGTQVATHSYEFLAATLRPGDVLLVEGNTRISVAIKYLTQSTWSHATFFVGDKAFPQTPGDEPEDLKKVIAYAASRIGHRYDMKNLFDLARYLFPTPPVPVRWRRRMIAFGSGDPSRAICSTLIAQAFQVVRYPILPEVTLEKSDDPGCNDCYHEILHIRHYSLYTPRDFDISPYFEVVKPTLLQGFDFHRVVWADDPVAVPAGTR